MKNYNIENHEQMRNKLITLLKETFEYTKGICFTFEEAVEINADYLISKGVFAPICETGDTVYFINGRYEKQGRKNVYVEYVDEGVVDNIVVGDKNIPQISVCNAENEWFQFDNEEDFGRIAFLSKEEAEQKLKEEKSDD